MEVEVSRLDGGWASCRSWRFWAEVANDVGGKIGTSWQADVENMALER